MSPGKNGDPGVRTPGPAENKTPATVTQLELFAGEVTAPEPLPATCQEPTAAGEPDGGDPFWRGNAWTALLELAETGRPFTSYDIVRVHGVGEPPHPNCWGPLLAAAREAGLIVAIGAAPSARPTVAKSLVRVWRGVESGAAA